MPADSKPIVSIPFGNLEEGVFVERPNRFLGLIDLKGKTVKAHVPDPGRLTELLFPGNKVMVKYAHSKGRKTAYDLVLADFSGVWVCVDTRYPNKLFKNAIKQRTLVEFEKYSCIYSEVTLKQTAKRLDDHIIGKKLNQNIANAPIVKNKTPESRFDFLLTSNTERPMLVEVKSVNLCVNGTGLFPDAPTLRGARHLNELRHILSTGLRTCAVFIAQRQDILRVSAHRKMDPRFAEALDKAAEAGVMVASYRCTASPECLKLENQSIPYCK